MEEIQPYERYSLEPNRVYLIASARSMATRVSHASATSGTLRNKTHVAQWSSTVVGASAPSGEIPECAMTPCDRFDLQIDLPGGVWTNKPGGVEVAVRWNIVDFGDNLLRLQGRRACRQVRNKFSCIDRAGKLAIPAEYDDAFEFAQGLAAVKLKGKTGT